MFRTRVFLATRLLSRTLWFTTECVGPGKDSVQVSPKLRGLCPTSAICTAFAVLPDVKCGYERFHFIVDRRHSATSSSALHDKTSLLQICLRQCEARFQLFQFTPVCSTNEVPYSVVFGSSCLDVALLFFVQSIWLASFGYGSGFHCYFARAVSLSLLQSCSLRHFSSV